MNGWVLLADAVVCLHLAWVLFVVLGQVAIVLGVWRRWSWARNPWFRWSHLTCTTIVAVEGAMGWVCPLTTWEHKLRIRGGERSDELSFVARIVRELLFYDVAQSTLNIAYVVFGTVVIVTAWRWPPRRFGAKTG